MKIFITGGTGFVGGAAIQRLQQDHELVAMCRNEASAEIIRKLGASPVICSLDTVTAANINGCQAVIHAAAKVEDWGDPDDFERVNVGGTGRLLAAAREAGVKRFIHIGTEAALFRGQHMRDIDESYPLAPHSPYLYSATKARAEQAVLAANAPTTGFETLVLRPRMIWGPNDQTILARTIEMIEARQFMWLDGGKAQTSTCHIHNLVAAISLALTAGKPGSAYFITDGERHRFKEFITNYLATAGVTPPNKSIPGGLARSLAWSCEATWKLLRLKSTPPITRFTAAILSRDCSLRIDKARAELGYKPIITVTAGMAQLSR